MREAVLIGLMMFLAGISYEFGLSLKWSIGVALLPLAIALVVVGVGILWEHRRLPVGDREDQFN